MLPSQGCGQNGLIPAQLPPRHRGGHRPSGDQRRSWPRRSSGPPPTQRRSRATPAASRPDSRGPCGAWLRHGLSKADPEVQPAAGL